MKTRSRFAGSAFALSIALFAVPNVQNACADDARIVVDDAMRARMDRDTYDAARSAGIRGSRTGMGPAAELARPGIRSEAEMMRDGDRTGQGPAADTAFPAGRSRNVAR